MTETVAPSGAGSSKGHASHETVLQEAERIINGDRAEQYGDCRRSFDRIAKLWTAYHGTGFTEFDVANMMILLKVSRTHDEYHRDSYVDIAGYAGLAEKLGEAEAPVKNEHELRPFTEVLDTPGPKVFQSAADFALGDVFTPTSYDRGRWEVVTGGFRFIYKDGLDGGQDWSLIEVDCFAPFKRANPTGPYDEDFVG